MGKEKIPMSQAIRFLKERDASFTVHPYRYEEHGGTRVTARELGMDEHDVVKTLVMEDDAGQPFIILMHGDRQVSTKTMARLLGVKSVVPCNPAVAQRHTGYKVGGTSPFGIRKPLRIYMEETIAGLAQIAVNAGGRGLMAKMTPAELIRILQPTPVRVAA